MPLIRNVRSAARALILNDGKLLAIEMKDNRGIFYILPGGGQRPGETLKETVRRECLEELDCEVKIGDLIYLREYIGKNHTFRHKHSGFHQIEAVFQCELTSDCKMCPGHNKDNHQVGVAWLPVNALDEKRFFPEAIIPYLQNGGLEVPQVYLGDIN